MMRPGLQVCRQGHVLALRSDAAARLPKTPALFDVARWLGAHGHVLATRPGALLQLAYEAPPTSLVYSMAERSDVAPEVLHLPSSKDAWPMEMAILSKHAGCVNVAAFSPSGDLIASAGVDASVRLWNPHTGACRN